MSKELLEKYKDQFTLDGKLKPQVGVTKEKVRHVKGLFEKAQAGGFRAEAELKELFTSSDASYSMAHLLNIQTIPQLPEEIKEVDRIAGKRTVRDFNPVVLRSLIAGGIEGAGIDSRGAAAIVPEGTPFPIVTVKSDEESFYQKLSKRGVRFDFTFESWINDLVGELEAMPEEILKITKNTIYAEIFDALDEASQELQGAELPDGTIVAPNARVSALAIIAAVVEIENREINGNAIGSIGSYNVFVPKGRKRFLEWDIAQLGRIREVQRPEGDVTIVLAPDADLQALFPQLTIIETDRLTGSAWKIAPRPGTTLRPVLERLSLRGYENPEIRVRSDQGFLPGGGKIGLFEGGFDADTASFRYRHITGAVLWDDTYVGISDGTGAA
jgi:hypothetical protein